MCSDDCNKNMQQSSHSSFDPFCTYEDPSELDIELRLDALWLVSERLGKLGTTS